MHSGASIGSWFLASAWLLLSIGLPGIFWATETNMGGGLLALVMLTLVYSSARLASLIAHGEPHISTGMVWFFAYVVGGVVPLAQGHTGMYPNLVDAGTLFAGQAILVTALLAFDFGRRVAWKRSATTDEPALDLADRRVVNLGRLRLASVGAIVLSVYYIQTLGGPAVFFLSRRELAGSFVSAGLRDGSQVGSAILLSLGQVPIIIVFAAWVVHYARNPERRTPAAYLWLALLLAINVVVNNPISNARYWFLTVVIGVVFAWPRFGPRLYRATLIGGILAALLAFPYSDYYRNSAADRGPLQLGPLAETLATKDYDQSVMTANGVWYADTFGHTFGQQLLGPLLFWVPRSLWPDKPLDTGVLIGQQLPSAGTTNLSSPLWIEVFLDFGFVGVAVAFFALGFGARRLDARFASLLATQQPQTYVLQLLLPFIAGYSLILLRGPLLQAMSRLSIILAVCWFIGTKVRQGSAPPGRTRQAIHAAASRHR